MQVKRSEIPITIQTQPPAAICCIANKDHAAGVKKGRQAGPDKPPKRVPISQDDINIIVLVPETTLY